MFYSSPPQSPQIRNGGELQECIAGVEEEINKSYS